MEPQTAPSALPDPYHPVVKRARYRDQVVIVIALIAIVSVALRGLPLWSSLPGEVPIRWNAEATEANAFYSVMYFNVPGFAWSNINAVHWVDKTPFTVFGQLLMALVSLGFLWVLIWFRLPSRAWKRVRQFLAGPTIRRLEAWESVFVDGMTAWLFSGMSVIMALDSWQMWSLALAKQSPGVDFTSRILDGGVFIGFGINMLVTWLQLGKAKHLTEAAAQQVSV